MSKQDLTSDTSSDRLGGQSSSLAQACLGLILQFHSVQKVVVPERPLPEDFCSVLRQTQRWLSPAFYSNWQGEPHNRQEWILKHGT